ncbi:MAG: tRNA (adenosine(37)-N6)-dimethylallyltransferase MiaA [Pirellulales bacterium]|nr:tRNA (adenosine(37)-N6)-dimethylallyltransferase MiaA [Pirellulales bacterium]
MSEFDFATDCWFLTGPTAAGKSAIGIELAESIGAEIVSLDSMAIYRGMDIGTAKPNRTERARVPHHLLDIVEPGEEFSLAEYRRLAERTSREIRSRGAAVLFVGGTPLYLKALLRGIFEGPPADWEFRRQWEQRASEEPDLLHQRVSEVDARSAQKLHPRDTRRLIRALEVLEKTGRPISDWQEQFDRPRAVESCRVFTLQWPREELYARINARVEAMFAEGLVEECRALISDGRALGRTARQALGYREVFEHLAGRLTLAETIDLVQRRTRQFARRQLTWFRSLQECRNVELSGVVDPGEVTRRIISPAGAQKGSPGLS